MEFAGQRRDAVIRALVRLGLKEQPPPPRGQCGSGPSSFVYFSVVSNEFPFGHRLENLLDKGAELEPLGEVRMPPRWWFERITLKFRFRRHLKYTTFYFPRLEEYIRTPTVVRKNT